MNQTHTFGFAELIPDEVSKRELWTRNHILKLYLDIIYLLLLRQYTQYIVIVLQLIRR